MSAPAAAAASAPKPAPEPPRFTVDSNGDIDFDVPIVNEFVDKHPTAGEESIDSTLHRIYQAECARCGLAYNQAKRLYLREDWTRLTPEQRCQARQQSELQGFTNITPLMCEVCCASTTKTCKPCQSYTRYATYYCSAVCQRKHRAVHKNFCGADVHRYKEPRWCESPNCTHTTTLGCKVCHMAYCSADCYTFDHERHAKFCRPLPSARELGQFVDPAKSHSLLALKSGSPLMGLPLGGATPPSKNVFLLSTDKRACIRGSVAADGSSAVPEDVCRWMFFEDYAHIMRMYSPEQMFDIARAARAYTAAKQEEQAKQK